MAPTQSERRAEAQAAIEAAALELFAERGFAGTSIQAIASRAGVSKGLVHHYFPTKDDLVLGVVQARQRTIAALAGDAPAELGPLGRLAWTAERIVAQVAADPDSFRVLLRAISDPGVHSRVQELVPPSQSWSRALEEAGVPDAEARAAFFRAALLGVLTTLATSIEPAPAEQLTAQLLALLPQIPSDQPEAAR